MERQMSWVFWTYLINTPSKPQAKSCWCRWIRSPGATVSCFDIGALLNDSTPPKPKLGYIDTVFTQNGKDAVGVLNSKARLRSQTTTSNGLPLSNLRRSKWEFCPKCGAYKSEGREIFFHDRKNRGKKLRRCIEEDFLENLQFSSVHFTSLLSIDK